MVRIGTTEAPFAIADLTENEGLDLRIFIDKYLIEVFANDRQAAVGAYMAYKSTQGLNFDAYNVKRNLHSIGESCVPFLY